MSKTNKINFSVEVKDYFPAPADSHSTTTVQVYRDVHSAMKAIKVNDVLRTTL